GATVTTPFGFDNINDPGIFMPVGSSIIYTVTATVAASSGSVINTATVTPPGGLANDNNPADNLATDTDPITGPDLTITKTNGLSFVSPGQTFPYPIVVSNHGALPVTGASVQDLFPASLTGVSWSSVASGGASGNTGSGSGNINDTVNLPVGSQI